ncbi:MAG: hypothetical protein ACPG40_01095 [Alphaproteobacteria bacterium]
MLWRLAFSAVALVFGLSLGAGLTRYMVQPELDRLRNQIEMQAIAHTEAEALWHVHQMSSCSLALPPMQGLKIFFKNW